MLAGAGTASLVRGERRTGSRSGTRAPCRKDALRFPYVCPEPVLVVVSVIFNLQYKMAQQRRFPYHVLGKLNDFRQRRHRRVEQHER